MRKSQFIRRARTKQLLFISILQLVVGSIILGSAIPSPDFFKSHENISIVFYGTSAAAILLCIAALIFTAVGLGQKPLKGDGEKYFSTGDKIALLMIGTSSVVNSAGGLSLVTALAMLTAVTASLGRALLLCLLVAGMVLQVLLVICLVEIAVSSFRIWAEPVECQSATLEAETNGVTRPLEIGDIESSVSGKALKNSSGQNLLGPKRLQSILAAAAKAWATRVSPSLENETKHAQERTLDF